MESVTSKKELRKEKLQALKHFSNQIKEKERLEAQLINQLLTSERWQHAQVIALYQSMAHECNTKSLLAAAWREGKLVVLPQTGKARQMRFVRVLPTTLFTLTAFGVEEPDSEQVIEKEAIDLMVVPGVCFTLAGKRIGYGGGFYDRYLEDYRGATVSLAFPFQLGAEDDWLSDEHDQLIQKVITVKQEEQR